MKDNYSIKCEEILNSLSEKKDYFFIVAVDLAAVM